MSNTRSKESCKDLLKHYDYLRKSYCTQVGLFGTYDKNNCEKTLELMSQETLRCMDNHPELKMKK